MEETEESEINNYVELYDEIQKKTGNTDATIAILQEIGKDARMNRMSDLDSDTATKKQKDYLKVLGIGFTETITKKEAHELIEQNKK